jgi:hypothetical protein
MNWRNQQTEDNIYLGLFSGVIVLVYLVAFWASIH